MVSDVRDDFLTNERSSRRELDVSQLGRRLSAQRWWLVVPTAVCFLGSLIFVNVVTPTYTGETKILLENQETYFTRPDKGDIQQPPVPDDEAVQSQVQLVSSRDLARAAIKQLDLQGNSEFDPLANGINPVTRLLVLFGLERDPMRVPPEERILSRYFDNLTVFPVTKSRVLTVEFEAHNAELAARAANTIADLYIDIQSSAKRDAARAAADSLRSLIADLRVRAADADAKVQALRGESGLVMGTNNTALSSQQLADMSVQLAQARSAEADAQAKAKMIRAMIKDGRTFEVADIANTDLMKKLSEQRAGVKAEVAVQARTLLPGHPRMQELNAQLADIDQQLKVAADKAARSLENDAHIAASRVENLDVAMTSQKTAIGASGGDQVKLSELDLNARLLKDQLEFNTSKYQEAVARENAGSTPADARVISRAVAPQLPSFPKKLPIIAIATIAGALFSLGIMIARELLSGRAFVEEDYADELPVSLRADHRDVTPITEGEGRGSGHEPTPLVRPTLDHDADDLHVARDPFLTLLDEILVRKEPEQAVRLLVCDVDPSTAAAQVTVRLGRVLSRSFRSIAVDLGDTPAHPERPPLARLVGVTDTAPLGLSDLLNGGASFAEVIHRDSASRLHFIAPGRMTDVDEEEGLANVLDALAQTYDFVLMGGPLLDGDAPRDLLVDHADVVILHVGTTTTPDQIAEARAAFGSPEEGGPTVVTAHGLDEEFGEPVRYGFAAA